MQTFVLFLTILYLSGPESVGVTKQRAEFATLQECVDAGQVARNYVIDRARSMHVIHIPRVTAVCVPH